VGQRESPRFFKALLNRNTETVKSTPAIVAFRLLIALPARGTAN